MPSIPSCLHPSTDRTEKYCHGNTLSKIEKTVPQFLIESEYIRLIRHFTGRADSPMGLRNLIIIMMPGTLGLRTRSLTAQQYPGYLSDVQHPLGERKGPPTSQHGIAL